ncbi:hypothetical protein KKG61_03515 [bacterium]|nr:hypothetical protein [bacterium]
MKSQKFLIFLCIFFGSAGFCKFGFVSTGARPIGIGGAVCGMAEPTAMLVNPACLSFGTRSQMTYSYATDKEKGDWWTTVYPDVKNGVAAISFVKRGDEKMVYFSYGRRGKGKASYGMNLKFVKSKEEEGIGIDSGLLVCLKQRINLGFSVVNLLSSKVSDISQDKAFILGVSFKRSERTTLSAQFNHQGKENAGFFGVEFIRGDETIRLGVEDSAITLGLGGELFGLDIDWAVVRNCHLFSCNYLPK